MSDAAGRTVRPGPALDHVVINVLRRMDAAAALFTELGFQLTPRGRHSLGSINHLMMTSGAYLELVGVPEDGPQRQDVLDSPFGLNGLVVASADADETFARLSAAGLPVGPPVAFSRPVTLGDRTEEARFRTVRLPTSLFAAGRIYHCQHLTPDLVWREPWFAHPNGFCGIGGFAVASPEPDVEAPRYAAACGAAAERDGAAWTVRLGETRVTIEPGSVARFAGLVLHFTDLTALEARARAVPDADWTRLSSEEAELALPDFQLTLRCRSARCAP
jgi:hypothetical protein